MQAKLLSWSHWIYILFRIFCISWYSSIPFRLVWKENTILHQHVHAKYCLPNNYFIKRCIYYNRRVFSCGSLCGRQNRYWYYLSQWIYPIQTLEFSHNFIKCSRWLNYDFLSSILLFLQWLVPFTLNWICIWLFDIVIDLIYTWEP